MSEVVKEEAAVGAVVQSTSDARVANNALRHQYRVLTEVEKVQMQTLKDIGADFIDSCDNIKQSAEMTIAKRKMEEAVMWAVKGLTA